MNFTANDVEQMLEDQRSYYYTGATKPADFRKAQLERLKQVILSNEQSILDALKKDLGKSEFEAYSSEIGI
ncbi:MAG TPA: aldehyde dehydrogenase, partial [Planococcus sp. (in: firmicutes)]|nr:aldehyde dehydrogenase [Planococcus sp. (in: firmicutes)]